MSDPHALEHGRAVPSLVPARMDRLPWTKFHRLIVIGLGVSWILDGLEIQLVSLVSTVLEDEQTLRLAGRGVEVSRSLTISR